MAVTTSLVIGAIGLAIAGAGAVTTHIGQQKMAKAQKKQEKIRKQQMNLDAMRRRRDLMRKMIAARALGLSNAVSQGASTGDSAVIGGMQQAVGTANIAGQEINQNQELGEQMFNANAAEASGRGTASFGNTMSSWGSGLVQNASTISRVGQSYGLWKPRYGAHPLYG